MYAPPIRSSPTNGRINAFFLPPFFFLLQKSLHSGGLQLPSPPEVMKIARFTSPLLDAPRQSLPRPRLRHRRQTCSSLSPKSNPKSNTIGSGLRRLPEIPLFLFSQPKTLRSRARGYLSELRRATCPEESSLVLLLLSLSRWVFLRLPPTFPPLPLAPDKVAYVSPQQGMIKKWDQFYTLIWKKQIKRCIYSLAPCLCNAITLAASALTGSHLVNCQRTRRERDGIAKTRR